LSKNRVRRIADDNLKGRKVKIMEFMLTKEEFQTVLAAAVKLKRDSMRNDYTPEQQSLFVRTEYEDLMRLGSKMEIAQYAGR
jgi:hypothetical protein